MPDIIVIGSLNMDLVVKSDRFPAPGETLHGLDFRMIPGGKGANQAAAIGKLGGSVAMLGRVGVDAFGLQLRHNLAAMGVGVDSIFQDEDAPTGTATIIVEGNGENRIIVVPGANARVSPADIDTSLELIRSARAVVLQFEIPLPTVEYAIRQAAEAGAAVILNPSPAYPIPDSLLAQVDYLILNEIEIAMLSGQPITDLLTAETAARILHSKGVGAVILTLGAQGALFLEGDTTIHVPTHPVQVVDTTAAGDTFTGAFALSLVKGANPAEAVRYAVAAGTLAVTRFGAQTSIPSAEEVTAFLT